MATHEYRIKCQACGLHYAVFSWDENWAGGPEEGRQGGWCPECGIKGGKFVWTVSTEGQIYEKVPGIIGTREVNGQLVGESPPLMITAGAKGSPFGYGKQTEETASLHDTRGPYGTNEGDKWLAPGSEVQNRLDAEGLTLIHENFKNDEGEIEERIYPTADDTLISEARQGHELWTAVQAAQN